LHIREDRSLIRDDWPPRSEDQTLEVENSSLIAVEDSAIAVAG